MEKDNKYQQEEEREKLKLVIRAIDCMTDYCFYNSCVLIFKKLNNLCISKRKVMFNWDEYRIHKINLSFLISTLNIYHGKIIKIYICLSSVEIEILSTSDGDSYGS